MATIVDFISMLSHAQWLSAGAMNDHRLPLLHRLLLHAETNVPAWAERLSPIRQTEGYHDLSRWQQLPVMTRRHLEEDLANFTTEKIPPQAGAIKTLKTSGTTRAPLAIPMNQLLNFTAWATTHRSYEWGGADPAGRFAALAADHRGTAGAPDGKMGMGWSALDASGPKGKLSITTPMDVQHAWLDRFGPDYVKTYPSNLAALLRTTANHLWLDRVRTFFTVGETLTEEQRATVVARSRARLLDVYATQEVGPIAIQCGDCGRYHVCEETVLTEIVDEHGEQQKPGIPGRVLVTSFYAYSTPFIRYQTGDYAMLCEGPSPCGRAHTSIERIMGRSRNAIAMPDGSRLWPRFHLDKLAASLDFLEVQMIQHTIRDMELRYVPRAGGRMPDKAAVQEHFRRYFYPELDLRLTPIATFPRSAGSKYEEMISLVAYA
jgi:phenylacetate-CoA ligase